MTFFASTKVCTLGFGPTTICMLAGIKHCITKTPAQLIVYYYAKWQQIKNMIHKISTKIQR